MNRRSGLWLLILIVLITFIGYVALAGIPLPFTIYEIPPLASNIKQGLDLKGGLYVVYEAQVDQDDDEKDFKIEGAIKVMRNRLDAEGQNEATIARQGTDRIVVEIPGVQDPMQLKEVLMTPAVLEFIDPTGKLVIGGKDVKSAKASYQNATEPVVLLELNTEGAKAFAEATTKYRGQIIEIVLDGNIISSPTVNDPILDGSGVITGMGNIENATNLANLIESGALPIEIVQLEVRTIGATLGADALDRGILAGIIGIIAILIYMLVFYRLPGIVADLALVVYLIADILIIVLGNVTLTLPGIAGIILSVGMAVDANVIIFERMKEELRAGKTLRSAVEAGFHKAFRAILDANVTTLIAASILWGFGTGPIQGFAKTLFIGIILSMLTAVLFTRFVLRLVINIKLKNLKFYGIKEALND